MTATTPAEIVPRGAGVELVQSPAGYVNRLVQTIEALQTAYETVLKDGIDYGVIPGTKKPSLFQPGAELLLRMFNLGFRYEVEKETEDWDTPFFRYRIKAQAIDLATGEPVGEGSGEANSKESRYQRLACPECGSRVWDNRKRLAEGKGRPGDQKFACRDKNDCGWAANEKPKNSFDFELVNTLLKMAIKRAKVAVALNATSASHFFTQDAEDLAEAGVIDAEATVVSSTSSGSKAASNGFHCPACGSDVWDNRKGNEVRRERGDKNRPAFSCKNKDKCTGANSDGELVSEGKAGEPWITWHETFFDPKPEAGDESDEMNEIRGHIATGAITGNQVLVIARRVAKEHEVAQPKSVDEIAGLSVDVQKAIAEAVAEKITAAA